MCQDCNIFFVFCLVSNTYSWYFNYKNSEYNIHVDYDPLSSPYMTFSNNKEQIICGTKILKIVISCDIKVFSAVWHTKITAYSIKIRFNGQDVDHRSAIFKTVCHHLNEFNGVTL
jgi:hypothetical protein